MKCRVQPFLRPRTTLTALKSVEKTPRFKLVSTFYKLIEQLVSVDAPLSRQQEKSGAPRDGVCPHRGVGAEQEVLPAPAASPALAAAPGKRHLSIWGKNDPFLQAKFLPLEFPPAPLVCHGGK